VEKASGASTVSPLLLVSSFFVGQSRGQESEPPLAIPIEQGPVTGSTTMARPDVPHTAADLQAAMNFRSGHLEIRTITSWHGGGSVVIHQGYRWGPRGPGPHWGVGVGTVVGAPMVPEHGWAVFQGPSRLKVPEYLDLVGDSRADDYRQRIRSNHSSGNVLSAVGVIGIAAVVTGIVGAANADFLPERREWNTVALAGSGGMLIGFTGASIAHGTARRLERDYGELGWEPTRAQVDAYNEKLRTQLGLSAEQTWQIIDEGGGGR
jgi:hypothetical protein